MAETKYIVYTLGEQRYCMKLSNINGIEQVYNIIPVPMGADYIKGIIHLRKQVLPIYDLLGRFGIEDKSSNTRQLLVTETHGMKMGFEVDDVLGIVAVPDDEIKVVPTVVCSEETGYLENVVNIRLPEDRQAGIVISVSIDNIMSESEFANVSSALEEKKNSES